MIAAKYESHHVVELCQANFFMQKKIFFETPETSNYTQKNCNSRLYGKILSDKVLWSL